MQLLQGFSYPLYIPHYLPKRTNVKTMMIPMVIKKWRRERVLGSSWCRKRAQRWERKRQQQRPRQGGGLGLGWGQGLWPKRWAQWCTCWGRRGQDEFIFDQGRLNVSHLWVWEDEPTLMAYEFDEPLAALMSSSARHSAIEFMLQNADSWVFLFVGKGRSVWKERSQSVLTYPDCEEGYRSGGGRDNIVGIVNALCCVRFLRLWSRRTFANNNRECKYN